MIFSELYSTYYNTVARILKAAIEHPLSKEELRSIIEKNAFGESILNIEPAIMEERWQVLAQDGSTALKHTPTMPLTLLEKRWLKAIFQDPRIKLFTDEADNFPEVEPLFHPDDVLVFDKYSDGDPYTAESYIHNFRRVMDAIHKRYPLSIDTTNRRGSIIHRVLMPEYMEYSEKDDKFRLIGSGRRYAETVNLGRIVRVKPYNKPFETHPVKGLSPKNRTVQFELVDSRSALERVLMHFAHFQKQAEKLDENRYKVTITYDKDDEMEIVIRILSFGPMVKVTAPQSFVDLLKQRLISQKSCGH